MQKRRLKITTLDELNAPFEFKAIKLEEPKFRRAYESAISKSLFDKGMICFSKKWDNPVMWSHYALLKKLKNGLMEELCRTKFKHWEYEKEIRLFLTIEDAEKEGKHLFADFDNEAMKLREIVMGSNYESCGEFEKLGVSLEDDISIITARCAFQNFSIVKQHCKKMQKTI